MRANAVTPEILDTPLVCSRFNHRRFAEAALGIPFVFVTHAQSGALTMADRMRLISPNKIEQSAMPRAFGSRPKSRSVAPFTGPNTVLTGPIEGADRGFGALQTPHGRFRGVPESKRVLGSAAAMPDRNRYGQGFVAGSPVRVAWDPSRATIIPAAA